MIRCRAALFAILASVVLPEAAAAQNRFEWKPGFMIPVGLGLNGGIGTWGARAGLIVGKATKPDEDDMPRAAGFVVLAEGATNSYQAVGVGFAVAGGPGLGPFVPMPIAAVRVTLNRATYNPYRNNVQRTATGLSLGFTYPLLNYGLTLYREHKQPGYDAGWQWRASFGIGF